MRAQISVIATAYLKGALRPGAGDTPIAFPRKQSQTEKRSYRLAVQCAKLGIDAERESRELARRWQPAGRNGRIGGDQDFGTQKRTDDRRSGGRTARDDPRIPNLVYDGEMLGIR
jgi:hypothetical protein